MSVKRLRVKIDTIDFTEDSVTNVKIVCTSDDVLEMTGSGTETVTVIGAKIGRQQNTVSTATHTILKDEIMTFVAYTATNPCTITLPAVADGGTHFYHIIDAGNNASVNNITIETAASETINGESNAAITLDGQSMTLCTDGANWTLI